MHFFTLLSQFYHYRFHLLVIGKNNKPSLQNLKIMLGTKHTRALPGRLQQSLRCVLGAANAEGLVCFNI